MKNLFLLFLFVLSLTKVNATTYSIESEYEFQNTHPSPGDVVNFYGNEINFTSTSYWQSNVTYQSGNGSTIISGFKRLSDWQGYSGNIYYIQLSQDQVSTVTLNNEIQAMGRYPNTGYLTYTGHAGNGTIWGPYYLPTNFTGAEAVVKKKRYLLDRHIIRFQGHDYLEFDLPYYHGNNDNEPTANNGFFIQNHLATLDRLGEWYFDKSTRRLYMCFGNFLPNQFEVKVAVPQTLISIVNKEYITIKGLQFEGADTVVTTAGSTSIKFYNCGFNKGVMGLLGGYTDNIQVIDSKVSDLMSAGIFIETNAVNTTIQRCQISNIGTLPGMGNSGDGSYTAITVSGDNTYINYNTVRNSGYHAINYSGNNVHIEKNLIDRFCVTKDDGGAVYSFCKYGEIFQDRYISKNIILNAVGNSEGALGNGDIRGEAAPIYLDGSTNHVEVSDNFLANGDWVAILSSPNSSNKFIGNVTYNFGAGIALNEYGDRESGLVRHIFMKNNFIVAKEPTQLALLLSQFYKADDYRNYTDNIGDWGNNVYTRPINQGPLIMINKDIHGATDSKTLNIPDWQQLGQDSGSQQPDVTTNSIDNFLMEYNASDNPKVVYLNGLYRGMWGEYYSGQITVSPWSGMVIIKVNQSIF